MVAALSVRWFYCPNEGGNARYVYPSRHLFDQSCFVGLASLSCWFYLAVPYIFISSNVDLSNWFERSWYVVVVVVVVVVAAAAAAASLDSCGSSLRAIAPKELVMAFAIAVMARMNGSDPTVVATFVLSRAENERRFRIYFCISTFNLYRCNSAIGCFACFVHVMAPDANTSIL